MPTITCDSKRLLDSIDIKYSSRLGEYFTREFTEEEEKEIEPEFKQVEDQFDLLCFSYGIENDGITELDDKSKGFKIDVPANRYDLLCFEGLSRALRVFLGKENTPKYSLSTSAPCRMNVHPSTKSIRPYVTCAILRNVSLNESSYQSFLDLQDHLHRNLCRKRSLVSIGTHDIDSPILFPVRYEALPRDSIKFKHLFNETGIEQTSRQVLDEFRSDPRRSHLKEYTELIYDNELYPVIFDSNNQVLSLPPIINGYHSRMSKDTKNIFIECTATDLTKASIVLDIMVTMFARYCSVPESVERVEVMYLGGMPKTVAADSTTSTTEDTIVLTPTLTEKELSVSLNEVNSILALNLTQENVFTLLGKMQLVATPTNSSNQETFAVKIPPTRADILHAMDVVEDVAIAYGFNDVPEKFPVSHIPGKELPINLLSDLLRFELAAAGYIEILTFGLCTRSSNFEDFGRQDDEKTAVTLANPKTAEYQIARTSLAPGLLKTIQEHPAEQTSHGLKLFEISDIVLLDSTKDTGAKNVRRLSALYAGNTAGLEIVHGLLDRVMQLCNILPDEKYCPDEAERVEKLRQKNMTRVGTYLIQPFSKSNSDGSGAGRGTYLPGKGIEIIWNPPGKPPVEIGTMGIVHPKVLNSFNIKNPVSILEITLDHFVDWV